MGSPKVVVDTNVAVSAALLPRSTARRAFDLATLGTLLVSEATLEELDDVLRRPKFDRYVPADVRLEFMAALIQQASMVDVSHLVAASRDPRDDKFLELAVSGNAHVILSGDDDLLSLNPFRSILIESPSQFLAGGLKRFDPAS